MEQGPYSPIVQQAVEDLEPKREKRALAFSFTGNASEYFRIWIVNTLLTVVTLGVYSAWAKIRNKQYFYRNTWVDGSNFEYLAKPLPILKGRLIAAAALGLLFASQHYSPTLYGILLVLYVLVTPWVVVKALSFNARNSAYRNLRFAFVGRTGEAFGVYLGMTLFYMVTCGLAYPYAQWRLTGFVIKRHLFGDLEFGWRSRSKDYYLAYLTFFGLILPLYIVLFAGMSTLVGKGTGLAKGPTPVMIALGVVAYAYLLVPSAFLRARVSNLVYGGTRIGPHHLSSNQRFGEVLKLYFVNAVAIVASLGLLIPWAKIRLASYRAKCLTLHAEGSLDAETLIEGGPNAVGEGLSDLGDFDLGIGTWIEFSARYYDGISSRLREVVVRVDEGKVVHVTGLDAPVSFPLADVRVTPRLGRTPRSLTLPDGAKCETDDQAALEALEQQGGTGRANARLHALESNWRGALGAALALLALIAVGIRWGIPLLAERVARAIPPALAYDLGRGTLAVFDKTFMKPSTLSPARQAELRSVFAAMARRYPALPLKLVFRRGPGPNAFALPDGTVVVTDELVELAHNDDEILSVLAHEIGHVDRRHSLRMALESSTAVLLASAYLGDVTQLTTLSAALPTVYAQAHYSQAHETEADTFALETMRASGIPPQHFANILRALQKASGPELEHGLQYLSSHPPTPERIRRFEAH